MGFYPITVNSAPMPSDINQLIDGLQGRAGVGAINFAAAVTTPSSAGTATAIAGSELGVGTYVYAVTYVTGVVKSNGDLVVSGETPASPTWTFATSSGNQNGNIVSLPTNSDTTIIGKRLYRTIVGGAQLKLVTTLTSGQTSYVDSTPDASLGANVPTTNTTGATLQVAGKEIWHEANVGAEAPLTAVRQQRALLLLTDTRTIALTYTSGKMTKVEEKDGATVVKTTDLTYLGDQVTTVVEIAGGKTVTSTLSYDGSGNLTSVTRSVT